MTESVDIDCLAVIAAAIVQMALGELWYSPVLFARPWMAAVGRSTEDLSGANLGLVLSAVAALVSAAVLVTSHAGQRRMS